MSYEERGRIFKHQSLQRSKGQKGVESHERRHSKWTRRIKDNLQNCENKTVDKLYE